MTEDKEYKEVPKYLKGKITQEQWNRGMHFCNEIKKRMEKEIDNEVTRDERSIKRLKNKLANKKMRLIANSIERMYINKEDMYEILRTVAKESTEAIKEIDAIN
jgi:KaiC/GvpD/RAD55 family RecA-like ATPase